MPYYSFIILCYNNWKISERAINTFLNSFAGRHLIGGIEFIIVDNGSDDGSAKGIEEIKERYRGGISISAYLLKENLGYIQGVNYGLSKACGEIITVLNNDIAFPRDWFDSLADALENDKTIGAAVPMLTNGGGPQNLYIRDSENDMKTILASGIVFDYFGKLVMERFKHFIEYPNRVMGACIVMRRGLLDKVGGLDYWFGNGLYDDDDWSFRAVIAGYRLAVIGESFVYHVGKASFGKNERKYRETLVANDRKFMRKWSLRGPQNEEGTYASREEAIQNTLYDRKAHFFPVHPEDYNHQTGSAGEKKAQKKRCLFVADWTNPDSRWPRALERLLSENKAEEEIVCWIPGQYFAGEEVRRAIARVATPCLQNEKPILKYMSDAVAPVDLLNLIQCFDAVPPIANDFVNKHIVRLAGHINDNDWQEDQ